jgi:hypothetical protein
MGYSKDDNMVRVDFFSSTGTWFGCEAVRWQTISGGNGSVHKEFALSLKEHFKDTPKRMLTKDAICFDPNPMYPHPVQIKRGGWMK